MSTLFKRTDFDSFDILFNNLLRGSGFRPFNGEINPGYPLNIYETDEFLTFEIPLSGANLDGLKITKTNDELRISYMNPDENKDKDRNWIYRGIANRNFEFAWRISPKFDLGQLSNTYSAGLLTISIPRSKASLPVEVPVLNVDENWKKVASGKTLDDKILDNFKKQPVFQDQ